MRYRLLVLAVLATPACSPGGSNAAPGTPTLRVAAGPDAGARLRTLLDTLRGPVRVLLEEGRYVLEPVPFSDPSCGNCTDASETVPATRALRLSGEDVTLEGAGAEATVLETRAGYGVLIEDCEGCALRGVTVTGGVRDPDGRATDAGVVVRASRAVVEDCVVRDNLGDSATVHTVVVGVAGVAVREGADLTLRRCRILRNSWDGVALYRDARARIEHNVVDGVDAASGARMGGGRGVGIGLTWNASATVEGNLVARYWKGIGVFVDARAEVRENAVEDVLTWGIAYWAAGDGAPVAVIERNVVYGTGACGVSVDRSSAVAEGADPGHLVGNALVDTGRDERYDGGEPYCYQRPIARHAVPAGFEIADNVVHDVRQPGEAWPVEETVDEASFRDSVAPLLEALRDRPALAGSRFLKDFGG